jgi:predicted alpha/beta superfamily hydrolase
MRDMGHTLRNAFRRVLRLEKRRGILSPGRLERIHAFESEILGNTRDITVYLPPGYDERRNAERHYPVLYMQDGQNLFDPERAFIPGQHWRLLEAADVAIASRKAEPMIIVGIDNAGADRIDEYTPTRDEPRSAGGRAVDYERFVLDELKPQIDGRFHTDAARTAVGGSSLGGLLTLFLTLHRPDVFTRAAVMSPSVWWNGRAILRDVDAFRFAARPRLWLDIGGREGANVLADARLLRDRLLAKGWNAENFRYYEDRRADHSERAWALRARMMLEFLFPA